MSDNSMIWLQIVINSAEYATGLGKLIAHHAMEWEEEVKAELIMTGKTILFTEMSGCLATLANGGYSTCYGCGGSGSVAK